MRWKTRIRAQTNGVFSRIWLQAQTRLLFFLLFCHSETKEGCCGLNITCFWPTSSCALTRMYRASAALAKITCFVHISLQAYTYEQFQLHTPFFRPRPDRPQRDFNELLLLLLRVNSQNRFKKRNNRNYLVAPCVVHTFVLLSSGASILIILSLACAFAQYSHGLKDIILCSLPFYLPERRR